MHVILLAVHEETMRDAHGIANMIFLFLPIFLAFVAGICMLVLTLRRDLDAGKAASLCALAGVIVFGLFMIEAKRHDAASRKGGPAPAAGTAAADPTMDPHKLVGGIIEAQRDLNHATAENRQLRERISMLESRLEAFGEMTPASLRRSGALPPAGGAGLPPVSPPPKGEAAAPPPPIAIPKRPGGLKMPDAGISPEMPKDPTPGPAKEVPAKPEEPKASEGAATPPPPPVDGGAGEAPKADEKP